MTTIDLEKYTPQSLDELKSRLSDKGLKFEIDEYGYAFPLIGVQLTPHKWDWFEILEENPLFLFFHHQYCQNTGKSKKGRMFGWDRHNQLIKKVK
jgi:hypothetical protein